jgi:uncharacterized membrane protein YciS (DUF1049 family)
MDAELGVALGLVGGALILGLFFLASRIENRMSRMSLRLDRLEAQLREHPSRAAIVRR